MKRIWLIICGDFVAFWVSFVATIIVRFEPSEYFTTISSHLNPFFILFLFWILTFYLFGLYDIFTIKPTLPHLRRFGMAIISCFFIGIFLFYFVQAFGISPKTNLLFEMIGFGIISFAIRRIIYILFSKTITRPAILVGQMEDMEEIKNVIENNPQLGLKIVLCSNDHTTSMRDYSNTKNAIFIFGKIEGKISKENILNIYKNNSEIIDINEAYERYFDKIPIDYVEETWIIENIKINKSILYSMIKKTTDTIIALFIIIVFSPFLIIAIIARLIEDGHPIFIKQKRVGKNGKIFDLYKLRSMIVLSPNGLAETNGVKWSSGDDDPRITKVGRIIRKLHIDEIPQMINIIKGDIALVGPRPERPKFVSELEKTIPHYELRHIILPGFTGWAQIKYRYARTIDDSKEKFEYDLYYIKNKNIFLDLGIILKTIQIIFTH